MVRLAHVLFIIQSLYLVFDFHVSNAFVTSAPPPPSPFNCMMNLRNERNHILERGQQNFAEGTQMTIWWWGCGKNRVNNWL